MENIEILLIGDNDKNKKVPESVTHGDKKHGSQAQIKISPEKAADRGGEDEHDIAASSMNESVESRGQQPSGSSSKASLKAAL
jgi:hypothetical protein